MTDRPQSAFNAATVRLALMGSVRKLDPRWMVHNPVMFVVEVGALFTTVGFAIQLFGGAPLGGGNEAAWFTGTVALWLWLTVVFGNLAEALAEGRGKAQADALRAMRTETVAKLRDGGTVPATDLQRGDVVVVEAGEVIPGDGTVIEGIASVDESADHRGVRAGDPRGRGRPQRRHRRHPGPLGPDRGRDHAGARQELSRPDDRARRGRQSSQDPERDRSRDPALWAHSGLSRGGRDAAPHGVVRRHRRLAGDPDRTARGADPHDDRGPAVGHRHRRHGPARAAQCAGALRAGGRGLGRRRCAALGQDRDDHAGQPPGDGVQADAGGDRARARRGGPVRVARRRDPRGPVDRRPRQAVRNPRARPRLGGAIRPVHGRDAHERRRPLRVADPQGRRRLDHRAGRVRGRPGAAGAAHPSSTSRRGGRHSARGRSRRAGTRRRLPEGRDQGRDGAALRAAARDGHQHRDGHRRQPADGGQDRRRVGGRRLSGPGDARSASSS